MIADVIIAAIGLGVYGICGFTVVYYKTHGGLQGEWNVPEMQPTGDGCASPEGARHGRDER